MHIYCKKRKKHTSPKTLNLISKNKIKRESKCAICLTERTSADEIKDELENELKNYLQFLTD